MNREEILQLAGSIETRVVKVRGRTFRVRGLTGRERDSFEQSCLTDGGERRSVENIRAKLLVRTIVDESGARLLGDGDADALGELPAAILDPLFDAASRLSGLGKRDVEDLAGN